VSDLSMATRLARNPELLSTDMDGETVMMSIEQGAYYGINSIGSRVWELLQEPLTLEAICEVIINEYEVEPAQCREDMLEFVGEMLVNNLVVTH
jgi:hypothetical protein